MRNQALVKLMAGIGIMAWVLFIGLPQQSTIVLAAQTENGVVDPAISQLVVAQEKNTEEIKTNAIAADDVVMAGVKTDRIIRGTVQ